MSAGRGPAPAAEERLHEIVANVGEGRDDGAIDRMAQRIRAVERVSLLDVHRDADHDRAVFTYCSSDDAALVDATLALADAALRSIDLRHPTKRGTQAGVHPRVGALDVVPVVPLAGGATLESAAAIAAEIARRLATEAGLPVHRYGAIARTEERRSLPQLRRGGFDGLAAFHATAAGAPDDGPVQPHPSGGAVAVGARPIMVAWNLELVPPLRADRLETAAAHARAIAAEIRGASAGGVAGLQARGFLLVRRGCAQVSMNLHDAPAAAARGATLHALRAQVARAAEARGERLGATEIVGLVPERLLAAGGDPAALEVRGGWTSASLERRLRGASAS